MEVLEDVLMKVSNAGLDIQTYHSKRLAELMVKIYECVVALGDAAVFGGERKRMVAELFIEYTWKKNEWLDSEMKSVKYFDGIVRYKV